MKPTNRIELQALAQDAKAFPSPKQLAAQATGGAVGTGSSDMASLLVDAKKAKGPRLFVEPILDRIFISSPEDENFDPTMEGGIHLPGGAARKLPGWTIVTAESVGPGVQAVKPGNKVFVLPAHCQQIVHDGQHYYWINEASIGGIVR